MLFSRSTEYAVRALTFLAAQPPGKLTGAREIAAVEHIPMPYLWKILQSLARQKLVRSFKGLRGGYELAQPPDQIPLHAIVAATNDDDLLGTCVLGLPACSEENACPLHETWKEIRARLGTMLDQMTLADLAQVPRGRDVRRQS